MNYSISRKDLWLSKSVINGVGINVPRKQKSTLIKGWLFLSQHCFLLQFYCDLSIKMSSLQEKKNTVCLF